MRHFTRLSIPALIFLSARAYATPPIIQGLDCIFPEPETVICSGQHPGDATTATKQLEDSSTSLTGNISSAASSALRSGLRGATGSIYRQELSLGLSAGNAFDDVSAWAAFTHLDTENDHLPTQFDSNLNSVLVGIDAAPQENMVVGFAVGLENTSVDTLFNAGEQDIDGITIAPYFGYLFNPNLSMDASFGYTNSDIDQFRLDATNLTSIIYGNTDSDRLFVSGNLNYYQGFDRWFFTGRAGVVYAEEDIEAVIETGGPDAFTSAARTLNFGQVQLEAELAYTGMEFEPYLSVVYENDFEREDVLLNSAQPAPANDDDSFRLGFGMRYYWSDEASIHFNFDWQLDRSEYDSHALSVSGRWAF